MFLFRKKSVGVDIADHTIAIAEVVSRGSHQKILNLGRVSLEKGIVESGVIKDKKRLGEKLREAFRTAKPHAITSKNIIFGLPESQVYTHIFDVKVGFRLLPAVQKENIVRQEAEQSIPLDERDLVYSYRVLQANKEKTEVILTAASKQIVSDWNNFFNSLGIHVDIFENEVLALARNVSGIATQKPVCIVDVGASTTHVAIFDNGRLHYAHSIRVAGDVITQEVAKSLKINEEEAEDRKIKIGISNEEEKNFFVIIKALEPIVGEIKSAVHFFETKTGKKVSGAILVGGSSRMPGLVTYFETNIGIPIMLGESNIELSKKQEHAFSFIEAVGLALRKLDARYEYNDPGIEFNEPSRGLSRKGLYDIMGFMQSHIKAAIALVILVLIAVGVIVFLPGSENKKLDPVSVDDGIKQKVYLQTQSFDVEISIATIEDLYAISRVDGRILEMVEENVLGENELLLRALVSAEKELSANEVLWKTPIGKEVEDDTTTFSWLIYNKDDAERLYMNKINLLNKEKNNFEIQRVVVDSIEESDNPNIFTLIATIEVGLDQLIMLPEDEKGPMVRVTDTETGWLNVRAGPGTSYSILQKINPGEEYEYLGEEGDWVRILLNGEDEGWASSDYLEKIESD